MKKLSGMEQAGKLEVLQNLMDEMDSMMGGDLDKKKAMKATVIAPDKKSLAKGLDKAEEVVEGESMDEESIGGEGIMDESEEDYEEKDPSECSPEELKEKIAELEAILASKTKKSDVKMPF